MEFKVPDMLSVQLPLLDLTGTPDPTSLVIEKTESLWLQRHILPIFYWLGVILSIGWLSYRLFRLFSIGNTLKAHEGFSFLGHIHLGSAIANEPMIYAHEQQHGKMGHSYDLLFIELVRIFNWFNPVLFLIHRELKFQHECMVDQAIATDKVAYAELLVAHALNTQPLTLSHEFSNKNLLKRRIIMLFKNKSKRLQKLSYLLVLPASLAILALVINCRGSQKNQQEAEIVGDSLSNSEVKTPNTNTSDSSGTFGESPSTTQESKIETEEKIRFPEPKIAVRGKMAEGEEKIRFPEPKITMRGEKAENYKFEEVEVSAMYKGGLNKFREDVAKKMVYPKEAIDKGVKGTVVIGFIIGKDGKPSDFTVIESLEEGIDQAAIQAIRDLGNWMPAVHNGKNVPEKFQLPIRVDLSNR